VIRELLQAGLMHPDVRTVVGDGLAAYATVPGWARRPRWFAHRWRPRAATPRCCGRPRNRSRPPGLQLLTGNLGRAVIKVSAVPADRHVIEAPARVFDSQEALQAAFQAGELTGDFVAVVRFQGPQANGMPELHKLTPPLAVLQGRGQRVALVTDGRMSGASGKVPAAIHVWPEALAGGPWPRCGMATWSGSMPRPGRCRSWSRRRWGGPSAGAAQPCPGRGRGPGLGASCSRECGSRC
jgi:phosphogluconate dehydratase